MTSVSCVVVVIFEKVYPVLNVKIAKLPEYLLPGGFDSPGLVSVCLK